MVRPFLWTNIAASLLTVPHGKVPQFPLKTIAYFKLVCMRLCPQYMKSSLFVCTNIQRLKNCVFVDESVPTGSNTISLYVELMPLHEHSKAFILSFWGKIWPPFFDKNQIMKSSKWVSFFTWPMAYLSSFTLLCCLVHGIHPIWTN